VLTEKNVLDEEDKENLKFILQRMYPDSEKFKKYDPTVRTLEVYVQAIKANLFCNIAMTKLTTELVRATVRHIYTGKYKKIIKKILKIMKDHNEDDNLHFFVCNIAVKYKYKGPLIITLEGF
jgi:uncharacterized FAD-dependent dehydrogenase